MITWGVKGLKKIRTYAKYAIVIANICYDVLNFQEILLFELVIKPNNPTKVESWTTVEKGPRNVSVD